MKPLIDHCRRNMVMGTPVSSMFIANILQKERLWIGNETRVLSNRFLGLMADPWVFRAIAQYQALSRWKEGEGNSRLIRETFDGSRTVMIEENGPLGLRISFLREGGPQRSLSLWRSRYDGAFWFKIDWGGEWSKELKDAALEAYAGGCFDRAGKIVPLRGEFDLDEDLGEEQVIDYLRGLTVCDYGLARKLASSEIVRDYVQDRIGLEWQPTEFEFRDLLEYLHEISGEDGLEDIQARRGRVIKILNASKTYINQHHNGILISSGVYQVNLDHPDGLISVRFSRFWEMISVTELGVTYFCRPDPFEANRWTVTNNQYSQVNLDTDVNYLRYIFEDVLGCTLIPR